MNRAITLVSFFILIMLFPMTTQGGRPSGPIRPLERLKPLPAAPGFVGVLGKHSNTSRRLVRLISVEEEDAIFPNAARQRYEFHFPRLMNDHILRVLDGFYRIDMSSPLSNPAFQRLTEAELPQGILAVPSTYSFPINGGGALHGIKLEISGICSKDENGIIQTTVQLSPIPDHLPLNRKEQTIQVDDILWIGDKGHKVRQIVATNVEQKLIGWIEIDQEVVQE